MKRLLFLLALAASFAVQAQHTMTVDMAGPTVRIEPTMYGIFFEDINFGADGGLYAELVKNRSFEFPQALVGWIPFGDVTVRDADPCFDRNPHYVRIVSGARVDSLVSGNVRPQKEGDRVRFISGNVLTGTKTSPEGFMGFYANQLTAIPEGDKYELLGWAMPRLNKFSVSRAYFSWLCPKKEYNLDTNLNGGERPFVVTGLYEQYLPMDIYPMYLLKACLAGDIDKMENLGIYEVTEEDFALCEFVDPSKIEIQQIIRDGINLMIKEA